MPLMQGTVVKQQKILSNQKQLEYLLLSCPYLDKQSYSVEVVSEKDGHRQFAIIEQVTCCSEKAYAYFDSSVSAAVRPETLHEMLYELIAQ